MAFKDYLSHRNPLDRKYLDKCCVALHTYRVLHMYLWLALNLKYID